MQNSSKMKYSNLLEWHHPLGENSKIAIKDESWLIFKEPKGAPIHSIHSGKVVVSGPDIPGLWKFSNDFSSRWLFKLIRTLR